MNSSELISIYESAYKIEFDSTSGPFEEIYQSAIDKKYAIEYVLGVVNFVYLFRLSSVLEQEIINMYDHTHKLGGNIEDVIKAIPGIIENYKTSEEHKKHFEQKKKNTIGYKRFLGIPYGIEKVIIEGEMKMGSIFETLNTIEEIAAELGRQRAIIDLTLTLQTKYIEHGGILDDSAAILPESGANKLSDLKSALIKNDLSTFFKILQELFASLSYNMKISEGYFHSHIHLLLHVLGFEIKSEVETNIGRIDSVIETEKYLHIFEFKRNDSVVAIDQILQKKYYQPFLTTSKKIVLVGVAIDTTERNIIEWQMQTFKP